MNVEQAREVSYAAYESFFAVIEQLQVPPPTHPRTHAHTDRAVCQAVKLS